jgi:branched-chain amino acid aminotransferase
MNVFLVMDDGAVHTPELTGSILEGVTRESILQLARDHGREVVERRIPLTELIEGLESGRVAEVFACGTAAVVTPIGRMAGEGFDVIVGDGGKGAFTMEVRDELTGIQYGKIEDRHGWMRRIA